MVAYIDLGSMILGIAFGILFSVGFHEWLNSDSDEHKEDE